MVDSSNVSARAKDTALEARRATERSRAMLAAGLSMAGVGCWLAALATLPGVSPAHLAFGAAGCAAGAALLAAVTSAMARRIARDGLSDPAAPGPTPAGTCERPPAAPLPAALAAQLADLKAEKERALAANIAKSRFLASISHEVRTPMTGILGMAELLKGTPITLEQKTYVTAIGAAGRTLLDLIDELLDLSKIEAGRLTLADAAFDLATMVRDTVELLAPRAHEKGLELAWEIAPDMPTLLTGDIKRMRQIVLNLLSNAIKFTTSGGVLVTVSARRGESAHAGEGGGRADGRLIIAVKDTGAGLSSSDIAELFTEFTQARTSSGDRTGGTGLGLSISRLLAHAMDGTITVESALGHGATFTIDLPLRPACQETTSAGILPATVPPRSFLIVSDRAIECGALARLLKAGGHAVQHIGTHTADGALDLTSLSVDVLIVDGTLAAPMAGSLLNRLRGDDPDHCIDAVFMVDAVERPDFPAYRAYGFEHFLVRPVRPLTLSRLIAGSLPDGGAQTGEPSPTGDHSTAHLADDATARSRGAVAASPAGATAPGHPRRPRVLLAEDNDINALLAVSVLAKSRCLVFRARNGREAVEAFRATLVDEPAYDLILMDIVMPELDGTAAAREIRALARTAGRRVPPMVALTANAFPEDRAAYLAAGLDDYLAKPFDADDIGRLLLRWIGTAAA